jgi:hypothetical protein
MQRSTTRRGTWRSAIALAAVFMVVPTGIAKLTVVSTGGNMALYTHDNRRALLYLWGGVPFKPYVKELYTPSGVNILRDAPADHLHHHGLMFAVTVNGVNFWEHTPQPAKQKNFWEEHSAPGKQEHISFPASTADGMTFSEAVKWSGPDAGSIVLDEKRTISAHEVENASVTLITWQSALHGLDGKPAPTYTGTKYHGLGMRFVESMDKAGSFFNSDGGTGVDGTNDKQSNWCAYAANADGKPVTVAMFDHPTNERHPATWFTMDTPFAYLSATLDLNRRPLQKLDLVLTYGVAVWDGHVTKEQVEETYQRWLALVEPLVASTVPAK